MKVFQVNFSDGSGGAARAAYRIHRALREMSVDSELQVVKALLGDWAVNSPNDLLFNFGKIFRPQLASLIRKTLKSKDSSPLSTSILPSRWPSILNKSDADIINLHWLCGEMMSIADIGKINKPTIWTMHDMWAFCGAEHISSNNRWQQGYSSKNRPKYESGLDLNRWVWSRKRKAWKNPFQIVTPSNWLADCVSKSFLMSDWPVSVIPNAINTDIWKPLKRSLARELLGIKHDVQLISFGAFGHATVHHKGFDLLLSALEHLRGQFTDLEIIIYGQSRPKIEPDFGFPVHYTGHLYDDISLRVLYSAVDALIIPSRIDNLPNTGVEALSCGTPVVAFDTCGLPDIVTHQKTGWLAKAFDTEDLARGIEWVLSDSERYRNLSYSAREYAVKTFSYPVVASQYNSIYQQVLANQ